MCFVPCIVKLSDLSRALIVNVENHLAAHPTWLMIENLKNLLYRYITLYSSILPYFSAVRYFWITK